MNLLTLPWLALIPQVPLELPMTDLKSSYPYGEQRALEVSSDNRLTFVAEGAVIAILDTSQLSQNAAPPIDHVEVPGAAPMGLAYYRHPVSSKDWLFIAGGSQGLWRIDLCSSLFATPPTSCGSYPPPVRLDVSQTANWERKVCIDVAVVDGNVAAGDPLLCAIYAARGDSAVGPSEARFYKLKPDGTVQAYGSTVSLATTATYPNSIAFAVAADPGNPNFVYVSLGTGWLHRIDITTSSFTLSPVAANSGIASCAATSCPDKERMRDIAIVKTETKGSFLYAALDYGRILEFEFATGNSRATTIGATFTDRIAAVTDGHDQILIAAANQSSSSVPMDSWVIFRALGVWYDQCFSYFAQDGNSGVLPSESKIHYYKRNAASSPSSPPNSELVQIGDQSSNEWWGSLVLRKLTSVRYGSYEANLGGTTIRRILNPFTSSTLTLQSPLITYLGPALGAGEGVVASINQSFTYFGGEGRFPGLMYVKDSPRDLVPIAGTSSLCSSPPTSTCPQCDPFNRSPNPYFGSLLGHTHWPDADGQHEWFMSGEGKSWQQVTSSPSCGLLGSCYQDPCLASTCWQIPTTSTLVEPSSWKLIRMQAAGITENSSPATIDMQWWQVAWNEQQQSHVYGATPYVYTMADPRTDPITGFPLLIHGFRGATAAGFTIIDGRRLKSMSVNQSTSCGSTPGRGEFLSPLSISVSSHPEVDDPTCNPGLQCDPHIARNWFSNKCDEFVLDGPTGPRYVVAIPSGYVATDPASSCAWAASAGQPMVVFYDVTDVAVAPGQLNPPVLLRVGLGTGVCTGPCTNCGSGCNSSGHAWCVRTKPLQVNGQTRTYAFVGDITARLLVFDVSYDQLFPAATNVYGQRLLPIGCTCFPVNPWDNQRDNLLDIELDGSFAYCALGRGGLGVVKILDPFHPRIKDIVDTPGLVEGIAMRTDPNGFRQLLAGDVNGGLHLFGRLGE